MSCDEVIVYTNISTFNQSRVILAQTSDTFMTVIMFMARK
jgi:hypothetical protein